MDRLVYGLRDPRDNKYYYIGVSYTGMERPLSHLMRSTEPKIKEWVNELILNQTCPQIDILERADENVSLLRKEAYYIKKYSSQNPKMLNVVHNINHNGVRTEDTDIEYDQLYNSIIDLPKIIKRERLFRHLSQEELASEAGLSRSTLSLLERGEFVNIETVHKVLGVLHRKKRVVDISEKSTTQRAPSAGGGNAG